MDGETTGDGPRVLTLPLDAIRPNPAQPRQRFEPRALAELAASLREHGVLQPVLVRRLDDDRDGGADRNGAYELVAGERRWQAARLAGLATVPALELRASPRRALELALVENLQRADLTPLEEAEAYRGLMATLGLTQERLAERLGISRVAVTNRLRLLSLSPATREALVEGRITEGHARALLGVADGRHDEALRAVLAGQLSVRQAERLARRLAAEVPRDAGAARADDAAERDVVVATLEDRLRRALGARVRVRRRREGVVVLLRFHSADDAYRLADALDPEEEDEL